MVSWLNTAQNSARWHSTPQANAPPDVYLLARSVLNYRAVRIINRLVSAFPKGVFMHRTVRKPSREAMTEAQTFSASAFMSKADRMARRLQEQHLVGCAAIEAESKGTSTATYAAEIGVNSHTLRKLKAFARLYYADGDTRARGRSSLEELCRLRRKDSMLGLHWGHLLVLLSIGTAADRLAWAKRAADNNWSPQRLRDELRNGGTAGSGRPLTKPATPVSGLAQVLREGTRWMARCELAVATCEAAPKQCRNAATRKMAEDVQRHWQTVRSKLAQHTKKLQAVLTSSQPRAGKPKPQPRPRTSR